MFNSGFIFEALGYKTADKLDIPFTYALSADRVGMVAIFNEDDLKCAEWYIENIGLEPIVVGSNSYRIFAKSGIQLQGDILIPFEDIPEEGYVFLSTWNVKNGEYINPQGVGLRIRVPLPKIKGEVIYQSGMAKILKIIPPSPPLPQKR